MQETNALKVISNIVLAQVMNINSSLGKSGIVVGFRCHYILRNFVICKLNLHTYIVLAHFIHRVIDHCSYSLADGQVVVSRDLVSRDPSQRWSGDRHM